MKKQQKKRGKAVGAPSVRALAKAVDRSHTTVLGWTRDDRWPLPTKRGGPWSANDVAVVRKWAASLAPNPADADADMAISAADSKATRETKLRLLRARAEKAESENAVIARRLVEIEAVRDEWVAVGNVFRAHVQNLPAAILAAALRNGLPGTACVQFQADVRTALDGAMQSLSQDVKNEK